MKRTLIVILALTVVVLMSLVETSAAAPNKMKANIGFSFYVDNSLLPAGEYWVELMDIGHGTLSGSAPAIRAVDGSQFHFLPARAQESYKNDPSCYLIFHHVGDSYFLRQVHQSTADVWLPKSRKQKEIVLSFPKGSREAAGTVLTVSADARN